MQFPVYPSTIYKMKSKEHSIMGQDCKILAYSRNYSSPDSYSGCDIQMWRLVIVAGSLTTSLVSFWGSEIVAQSNGLEPFHV